jgi:hypothetical protein
MIRLCGTGVGVHLCAWLANRFLVLVKFHRSYLSLATGEGDVHETASVRESLLGTALGGLGLLLLLNLFTMGLVACPGMTDIELPSIWYHFVGSDVVVSFVVMRALMNAEFCVVVGVGGESAVMGKILLSSRRSVDQNPSRPSIQPCFDSEKYQILKSSM